MAERLRASGSVTVAELEEPFGVSLMTAPRDLALLERQRLARRMLGGGTLGDAKILERSTVDAAFANQLGALDFPPAIKTVDPQASCDFSGVLA